MPLWSQFNPPQTTPRPCTAVWNDWLSRCAFAAVVSTSFAGGVVITVSPEHQSLVCYAADEAADSDSLTVQPLLADQQPGPAAFEEFRHANPKSRWQSLKHRSATTNESTEGAVPEAVRTPRQTADDSAGSAPPFPEDFESAEEPFGTATQERYVPQPAEPSADNAGPEADWAPREVQPSQVGGAASEPDWVVPNPANTEAAPFGQPAVHSGGGVWKARRTAASIRNEQPEAPQPALTDDGDRSVDLDDSEDLLEQNTGDDTTLPEESEAETTTAIGGDVQQTAVRRAQQDPLAPIQVPAAGSRRIRALSEISPFYDRDVDADIRSYAEERAADYSVKFGGQEFQPRAFADTAVTWEATNFYHYPLYFEDPALERYGHTYHPLVQPFVSGGRFMGQLVGLPYQMTIDPVCKRVYALGWYRPGEVAPKLHYQIPLNAKAAAVEAGVVTGLFFLIP
jgi:hypothetical protein